jgi:hypothetical protein
MATERPRGWDVGLIPWSAIRAWAQFYGFDREATRIIIRVIRTVDVQIFDARKAKEQTDRLTKGRK